MVKRRSPKPKFQVRVLVGPHIKIPEIGYFYMRAQGSQLLGFRPGREQRSAVEQPGETASWCPDNPPAGGLVEGEIPGGFNKKIPIVLSGFLRLPIHGWVTQVNCSNCFKAWD